MAVQSLTEDDKGKDVVDDTGEKIGIISGVRGETAYVDPDPEFTDRIKTTLDVEAVDEDDYPLDETLVEAVTDDEVRLKHAL